MGEAKNRLDILGPSRTLRVERTDLINLINYLMTPNDKGKARFAGDRMKRRSITSAMQQIGVLSIWRLAKKTNGAIPAEVIARDVPEVAIREVSVDAIRTIQGLMTDDLDMRDALNFSDFEDMLEEAIAGTFDPGVIEPDPTVAPPSPPPPSEAPQHVDVVEVMEPPPIVAV